MVWLSAWMCVVFLLSCQLERTFRQGERWHSTWRENQHIEKVMENESYSVKPIRFDGENLIERFFRSFFKLLLLYSWLSSLFSSPSFDKPVARRSVPLLYDGPCKMIRKHRTTYRLEHLQNSLEMGWASTLLTETWRRKRRATTNSTTSDSGDDAIQNLRWKGWI